LYWEYICRKQHFNSSSNKKVIANQEKYLFSARRQYFLRPYYSMYYSYKLWLHILFKNSSLNLDASLLSERSGHLWTAASISGPRTTTTTFRTNSGSWQRWPPGVLGAPHLRQRIYAKRINLYRYTVLFCKKCKLWFSTTMQVQLVMVFALPCGKFWLSDNSS
jgi:hypothetical protein